MRNSCVTHAFLCLPSTTRKPFFADILQSIFSSRTFKQKTRCTEIFLLPTGSFSSIKAWFSFKRRTTYFFYQSFMPTIFLVIISWFQFWISPEAVPARVSLSVTTVLAILFLSSTINENMPKVSYMKAIDYFLSVSFLFIFCTLLEYVLVLNTSPGRRKYKEEENGDIGVRITFEQR